MKPKKQEKSFTLMEVVVVGGIIVLFSALALPIYRQSENFFALLRSAHKVSQDLRMAQEKAMSVHEFQGSIPKGGYGIYFSLAEPETYIMFADCDGDKNYDDFGAASDCGTATPAVPFPEKVEQLDLEKRIIISDLSSSPLIITFSPPDPSVDIVPEAESGSITLFSQGISGQSKTITVNKAGLIELH